MIKLVPTQQETTKARPKFFLFTGTVHKARTILADNKIDYKEVVIAPDPEHFRGFIGADFYVTRKDHTTLSRFLDTYPKERWSITRLD